MGIDSVDEHCELFVFMYKLNHRSRDECKSKIIITLLSSLLKVSLAGCCLIDLSFNSLALS